MKTLNLFLSLLLLGACTTTQVAPEPVVRTIEVNVPVPSPCVPKDFSSRPAYADTEEALTNAVDAAQRYLLLWTGRLQRMAREEELQTVVDGCPREE